MFSAVLFRTDIYGFTQLQTVYIIQTTLHFIYTFPVDGKQNILSDFFKVGTLRGAIVVAIV
jgi:hypothetical protein